MPGATVVTVEPDTVHTAGVLEVNDTGSPEVADADKATGVLTATSFGCANAIVCPAFTRKERVTSAACAYSALPPCEAVTVHVPSATVVTVRPDTVHTPGVLEVNDTGSREVADATTMTGVPTVTSSG